MVNIENIYALKDGEGECRQPEEAHDMGKITFKNKADLVEVNQS